MIPTWYRIEYKLDDGKRIVVERDEWVVPGNAFAKILHQRGESWVRRNVEVSYCPDDEDEYNIVDIETLL